MARFETEATFVQIHPSPAEASPPPRAHPRSPGGRGLRVSDDIHGARPQRFARRRATGQRSGRDGSARSLRRREGRAPRRPRDVAARRLRRAVVLFEDGAGEVLSARPSFLGQKIPAQSIEQRAERGLAFRELSARGRRDCRTRPGYPPPAWRTADAEPGHSSRKARASCELALSSVSAARRHARPPSNRAVHSEGSGEGRAEPPTGGAEAPRVPDAAVARLTERTPAPHRRRHERSLDRLGGT